MKQLHKGGEKGEGRGREVMGEGRRGKGEGEEREGRKWVHNHTTTDAIVISKMKRI